MVLPVDVPDDVAHHLGGHAEPHELVRVLVLEMLREVVGAALVGEAERAVVELLLLVNGVLVTLQIGVSTLDLKSSILAGLNKNV